MCAHANAWGGLSMECKDHTSAAQAVHHPVILVQSKAHSSASLVSVHACGSNIDQPTNPHCHSSKACRVLACRFTLDLGSVRFHLCQDNGVLTQVRAPFIEASIVGVMLDSMKNKDLSGGLHRACTGAIWYCVGTNGDPCLLSQHSQRSTITLT